MYKPYLLAGMLFFAALLIVQLVRMNILFMRLKKDRKLAEQEIKEDKDWEFIKGLY